MVGIPVCYKGVMAMYGITPRRLQTIQEQLTAFGEILPDKRDKHKNQSYCFVQEHIVSKR